jgi:hypothetical protein
MQKKAASTTDAIEILQVLALDLRQLEVENGRLKKLVAERDLEIEVMKEIAAKKW